MFIFSVLMLALCGTLYLFANSYLEKAISKGGGPAFFPKLILVLLLIIFLFNVLKGLYNLIFQAKKITGLEGDYLKFLTKDTCVWLVFITILLLIPVFLVFLGFKISVLITYLLTSLMIKYKSGDIRVKDLLVMVSLALVLAFGLSLFFEEWLRILLPRGSIVNL